MTSLSVCCPKCGTEVPGVRLIEVEGVVWLDAGVILVESGRRYCHVCGNLFHWKRPRMGLAELAARQAARAAEV